MSSIKSAIKTYYEVNPSLVYGKSASEMQAFLQGMRCAMNIRSLTNSQILEALGTTSISDEDIPAMLSKEGFKEFVSKLLLKDRVEMNDNESKVLEDSFEEVKGLMSKMMPAPPKVRDNVVEFPEVRPICNLWIEPKTRKYIVDRLDHPSDEVFPVYSYSGPKTMAVHTVFETEDENTGIVGRTDASIKRVECNDDGSISVVINHWPKDRKEPSNATLLDQLREVRAGIQKVLGTCDQAVYPAVCIQTRSSASPIEEASESEKSEVSIPVKTALLQKRIVESLNLAFNMGKSFWSYADNENPKVWKKADQVKETFDSHKVHTSKFIQEVMDEIEVSK